VSADQARRLATKALKAGRLSPDHWCEVEDLALDGRDAEAIAFLEKHQTEQEKYPLIPQGRDDNFITKPR